MLKKEEEEEEEEEEDDGEYHVYVLHHVPLTSALSEISLRRVEQHAHQIIHGQGYNYERNARLIRLLYCV